MLFRLFTAAARRDLSARLCRVYSPKGHVSGEPRTSTGDWEPAAPCWGCHSYRNICFSEASHY